MADGSYIDVPVKVGLRSGSDIEITSDQLKEGDEVKLTKVTSMMGNSGSLSFGMFGSTGFGLGGGPGGGGAPGGGRPNGGGGNRGGGQRPQR